jgi:hypothetical protein
MIRKTILAAAAVATLGAASIAAALALGPSTYYEFTYYSDASLTEEVGYASEYCNGSQILMGQAVGTVTPHYTQFPIGNCPGGEF